MIVVDASALLAFLQGEPGAERVEEILDQAVIGAANWAEVAQKVRTSGADWGVASGLLLSYRLKVEPVTQNDGEVAAGLWARGRGLSLGDRLCLALGRRLDAPVLTADRAWGVSEGIEQLR